MSSGPRQNLPAICRYRRTDAPGPIYRTREFQRVLEPAKSLYQDESGNQEAKKRLIRLRSSSWIPGFQICSSVLERESRDGARFCASLFPAIAFPAEFWAKAKRRKDAAAESNQSFVRRDARETCDR